MPTEKKVEELSEEEQNYLYFKVHDLDGNDKLDGLEIFYSATHHHSVSEDEHENGHDHNHDHNESDENAEENAVSETNDASEGLNGSAANADASIPKPLELDENDEIINKNFNHIIGSYFNIFLLLDSICSNSILYVVCLIMIIEYKPISDVLDNFLNLADLNNDGFLNYAEYAAAVKLGNAMVETEQHPEL